MELHPIQEFLKNSSPGLGILADKWDTKSGTSTDVCLT